VISYVVHYISLSSPTICANFRYRSTSTAPEMVIVPKKENKVRYYEEKSKSGANCE